jgi:hypothetical protein
MSHPLFPSPNKAVRGSVSVGKAKFHAGVMPDPFDARDLEYRPRLQVLEAAVDNRRKPDRVVLRQDGNSCTGHAVAAMVNAILPDKTQRVSPYMLYYLARRYDEFPGDEDSGSSLRGVLKGWWRHGVCLEHEWKSLDAHIELTDEKLLDSCRQRPLGAFYRVNAKRLDDMQSAITEIGSIVASAQIHDGWNTPEKITRANGKPCFVIQRTPQSRAIGGHAFAFVGYNEIGFLVQNSWGKAWGKGGFATLPYEDWLESGWDAWVARQGVPLTPFERVERSVTSRGTFSITSAANLDVVKRDHVVNLGNDGHLSTNGKAVSSPEQLDGVVAAMKAAHKKWGTKDVVFFAHGGLVSETGGLGIAARQYQWWLNNHVYPIFFVWQSGPLETALDQLADQWHKLPFGAGFDFTEAVDRMLEKAARNVLPWAWAQMKQNAIAASDPLPNAGDWRQHPGASMLAQRLATAPGLKVHLVGHSTGAVFHATFAEALRRAGIATVESMAFLAAAVTVDVFKEKLRARIQNGSIRRFANFVMSDKRELDDVCEVGGRAIYHKSLLYLVSRGFEKGQGEVPLVGMELFAKNANFGGDLIVAESKNPPNSRSNASSHGGFDEDVPTMTSVAMRALNRTDVLKFEPNAPAKAPAGATGPMMAIRRRPEPPRVERRARPRGTVSKPVTRPPQKER